MPAKTLTPGDVLTGLTVVLDQVTGIHPDRVVPEASFENDLGVDSLSMVEVLVACEDTFGVRIPDETIESIFTVGDAVAFIVGAQTVLA